MKRTAAVLVFLLFAPLAWGASATCTTAWVTAGACRSATNIILFYDAPPASFADLRDVIAAEGGYQTELICQPNRDFLTLANGSDSRILSAAGAAEGDCTAPQVGTAVANPQTPAAFADAFIESELKNRVIRYRNRQAVEAADDPSAQPSPDLGAP